MTTHPHDHGHAPAERRFGLALLVTAAVALLEAVGGVVSGSIALLSDAGHMIGDASALAIAMLGARLASRPPSQRHSFGLVRADVLAASINALFLLGITVVLVHEALPRLGTEREIDAITVIVIGGIGLLANLVVIGLLGHANDLNSRAARLHVMGDLLGSVAAVAAGIVIVFTGWTPIDALLSLFICSLILISAVRVLMSSVHVFMEGVPAHLNLPEVAAVMRSVDGVHSVHDLHVWMLGGTDASLSAHVIISDLTRWPDILDSLRQSLDSQFGITHVTLQPEIPEAVPLPDPGTRSDLNPSHPNEPAG